MASIIVRTFFSLLFVSLASCSAPVTEFDMSGTQSNKEDGVTILEGSRKSKNDELDTITIGDVKYPTTPVTSREFFRNCAWSLKTRQSSSMTLSNITGLVGTGKIGGDYVYALADVGKGRVVFSGDTNLVGESDQACPVWPWLGGTFPSTPRVLVFGRGTCSISADYSGNGIYKYPGVQQVGAQLPAQYVNHPTALKRDFDMVVYCTASGSSNTSVINTLTDFVRNQGGGLYVAHEYFGFVSDADVAAANALTGPMGVLFQKNSINWSDVGLNVQFQ